MKLLLMKCAICDAWHNRAHHCPICGAHRLKGKGIDYYVNRNGVMMARSIPRPIESTIKMYCAD